MPKTTRRKGGEEAFSQSLLEEKVQDFHDHRGGMPGGAASRAASTYPLSNTGSSKPATQKNLELCGALERQICVDTGADVVPAKKVV